MAVSSSDFSSREHWDPKEFDEVFLAFEDIQTDLNYAQARDSLKNIVEGLDLTPREQVGLEEEIERLVHNLEKLDRSLVQIAAFGMVGRGKSSVLNALLGKAAFEVGPIHGVTQDVGEAYWDREQGKEHLQENNMGERSITISSQEPSEIRSEIQLIDTPGLDEVDGETRATLARKIAQQVDLLLFVIAGDITKIEYQALVELREVGKPIILVFNKIDQYPEADRALIYEKIRDDRLRQLISPNEIVMVAASPLLVEKIKQPDGSIQLKRYRGEPEIEPLKLKILEILEREGKALVALNTMLYADEVHQRIVQRKMLIRERMAEKVIMRAVMTKAIAVGLNPVTVLDLLTGAVIDVSMIISLSHLYGIPMSDRGALELLQKIALSMGGISASEFLASLGLSGFKSLLGLATPATGGATLGPYISIAMTQGSVAGVSTYAIGQVTKTYLANGATWGIEGPKSVVHKILNSLDETSILNRIKDELNAKLKSKLNLKTKLSSKSK